MFGLLRSIGNALLQLFYSFCRITFALSLAFVATALITYHFTEAETETAMYSAGY